MIHKTLAHHQKPEHSETATIYGLKLKCKQQEKEIADLQALHKWLTEGERDYLLQLVEDTKNDAIGSILVKFDGVIEYINKMYNK